MTRTLALSVSLLLAGFLTFGPPGHTQGYTTGSGANRTSQPAVDDVLRGFTSGAQQLCGNVPDPAYRVDCLADYFDWLADRLPQSQDFREAQSILRDAARQMNRVARENASSTRRPAVIRQNSSASSKRTSRAVIPVAPERQAAARAAAVAIVKETQTRLLRAAERSERRKVAFTNIAAAIGNSSLILLRSG